MSYMYKDNYKGGLACADFINALGSGRSVFASDRAIKY